MQHVNIKWTYTHHLNSRSSIRKTKHGVYFGKIKHTARHWRNPYSQQMALVQFRGNKHYSKVPYNELVFETL